MPLLLFACILLFSEIQGSSNYDYTCDDGSEPNFDGCCGEQQWCPEKCSHYTITGANGHHVCDCSTCEAGTESSGPNPAGGDEDTSGGSTDTNNGNNNNNNGNNNNNNGSGSSTSANNNGGSSTGTDGGNSNNENSGNGNNENNNGNNENNNGNNNNNPGNSNNNNPGNSNNNPGNNGGGYPPPPGPPSFYQPAYPPPPPAYGAPPGYGAPPPGYGAASNPYCQSQWCQPSISHAFMTHNCEKVRSIGFCRQASDFNGRKCYWQLNDKKCNDLFGMGPYPEMANPYAASLPGAYINFDDGDYPPPYYAQAAAAAAGGPYNPYAPPAAAVPISPYYPQPPPSPPGYPGYGYYPPPSYDSPDKHSPSTPWAKRILLQAPSILKSIDATCQEINEKLLCEQSCIWKETECRINKKSFEQHVKEIQQEIDQKSIKVAKPKEQHEKIFSKTIPLSPSAVTSNLSNISFIFISTVLFLSFCAGGILTAGCFLRRKNVTTLSLPFTQQV